MTTRYIRAPRLGDRVTILLNSTARDSRISYRARGILVRLLGNAEGFGMTASELSAQGTEGREAVRTALRELKDAGYIQRRAVRAQGGRFRGVDLLVFDAPQPTESPETRPSVDRAYKSRESNIKSRNSTSRAEAERAGTCGGETPTPAAAGSSSLVEKSMEKAKAQPGARGARLPSDWVADDELLAWAMQKRPDVDPDLETEKFVNYWVAMPGAKGRKLDWSATWRNWILGARSTPRYAPTLPEAAPPSKTLQSLWALNNFIHRYGDARRDDLSDQLYLPAACASELRDEVTNDPQGSGPVPVALR